MLNDRSINFNIRIEYWAYFGFFFISLGILAYFVSPLFLPFILTWENFNQLKDWDGRWVGCTYPEDTGRNHNKYIKNRWFGQEKYKVAFKDRSSWFQRYGIWKVYFMKVSIVPKNEGNIFRKLVKSMTEISSMFDEEGEVLTIVNLVLTITLLFLNILHNTSVLPTYPNL